jgi:hypothetical protein
MFQCCFKEIMCFRHSKPISYSGYILHIVSYLYMFIVSSVSLPRLISLLNFG